MTLFNEFFVCWDLLHIIQLTPGVRDRFIWSPSVSGIYSFKSTYERFFVGSVKFERAKRIWKIWTPPRCKFSLWLPSPNRCWTADRLARKGMDHPAWCPLCEQENKMVQHLLVGCVFARQVQFKVFSLLGRQQLTPKPESLVFQEWWSLIVPKVPKEFREGLNSVIALVSWWWFWKHHNAYVFDGGLALRPQLPHVH